MPATLTDRERAVYEYLYNHTREHGYQPGIPEIANRMGWRGFSVAQRTLRRIETKGWIELVAYTNRAARFLYTPAGEPFRGFRDQRKDSHARNHEVA